uniref:SSD domain-containing protein n=1 Tax=Rhabditophanes sp. KR3021 TaxID=114890 RepID=A0AC35U5J3_9BILA
MLTLIEAPSGKNSDGDGNTETNRSGQQRLLNYRQDDSRSYIDDDSSEHLHIRRTPQSIKSRIKSFFVGNSNSDDYAESWKAEFRQRPTMCDADMALQQIEAKNATGWKASLYMRSIIQNTLFRLGSFVQSNPLSVIATVFCLFSICCYGLQFIRIETDIVKLWVSQGGRLDTELNYFGKLQETFDYRNKGWSEYQDKHFLKPELDLKLANLSDDGNMGGGYQVLIQTGEHKAENLLTKDMLLEHVNLIKEISDLSVEAYGMNWTLADLCFKPGDLNIDKNSPAYSYRHVLGNLIPCIWITPIDCFFEGAKPLGPNPGIKKSDMSLLSLVSTLPDGDEINWKNLDPQQIISDITKVANIGTMKAFFERSGIGKGYLDRPCIDPMDPECPRHSPNYYDSCPAFTIYEDEIKLAGKSIDDYLVRKEIKESEDMFAALGCIFGGCESSSKNETAESRCKHYRESFLQKLKQNSTLANDLFVRTSYPSEPNYGEVMKHGCSGFARGIMKWSKDMILGGVNKTDTGMTAEALQTVFLVATPKAIYSKYANKESEFYERLISADMTEKWDVDIAKEVMLLWQRKFTQSIYKHRLNFVENPDDLANPILRRRLHPLASTSIADMLEEFCQFNFGVILAGYGLMLLYAMYSQAKFNGWKLSHDSSISLALSGVLTVTFASVAGLGLSTWFGIEFNAATTQIVPFLTLGIGVDNMFLLLHNYHAVVKNVKKNEIGVLMKETGMSILMTSINNILSFLAGTVLPIPALRSFCTQSSILLSFNLIAILTVYPALISIDLIRVKKGLRDVFCWSYNVSEIDDDAERSYNNIEVRRSIRSENILERHIIRANPANAGNIYQSLQCVKSTSDDETSDIENTPLRTGLHRFIVKYYIPFIQNPWAKFGVGFLCLALAVFGVIGTGQIKQGLELSDVLPENTAPAAFLKARDQYFSFYPMTIVIMGEEVDFARKQKLIANLRSDIGSSNFIVKHADGEPSEPYWLDLLKNWVIRLQEKLDLAEQHNILLNLDDHIINGTKEALNPDLQVAYSLLCSHGELYNCSRIGHTRLIDSEGIINVESFYNILYGWHEYETMLYAVSQANFYPKLFKLREGVQPQMRYRYFIPPAPKPLYSAIPFYLNGLTDTPIIVEMINEIRAICERYSEIGIKNFPEGVAFTFWEQYINLNETIQYAISIIIFAVFVVITILLINPWAAGCICLILLVMTIELSGFLGIYGIKLNPVSAVSIITAVGIGVEFTAHVLYSFLTALGTRNERMVSSIDRVFVPVIHGAISTLLGILMLGFSEFEFVVKYFFVIMTALIIIGLINGLALLPVVLSLIGPPCEIYPTDGKNQLNPPPSLSTRRNYCQKKSKHRTSVDFPVVLSDMME